MNNKLVRNFLSYVCVGGVSLFALSGCATNPGCCTASAPVPAVQVACCETLPPPPPTAGCCVDIFPVPPYVAAPNKLTATGYGAVGNFSMYTVGQQKLMARRAAQLDAYRNLAEQVYGLRITGNTSVSAFATQNDSIRSYVDAFIRGARVVNTATIADDNIEVTVELDVTPAFVQCISMGRGCYGQPMLTNYRY